MAEDKKKQDKKEEPSKAAKLISDMFGGMLGKASDSIKGRKNKVDEEINNAERPPMSRKWTE